jgi:hypothetical protein
MNNGNIRQGITAVNRKPVINGNIVSPSENKFRAHIPVFSVIYFRLYYSGDENKEN